jgi:hypothetical protein
MAPSKKARLGDRNPLSATDSVFSGYEQAAQAKAPEVSATPISEPPVEPEPEITPAPAEPKTIKTDSQKAKKSESQLVYKKTSLQLREDVVDALDTYHLGLQVQLGKKKAPFKETVIEEAIAQFLERANKSPENALKALFDRQNERIGSQLSKKIES